LNDRINSIAISKEKERGEKRGGNIAEEDVIEKYRYWIPD
jgi:hypothetical protein